MSLIPFTVTPGSIVLVNEEIHVIFLKAGGINLPMNIGNYEAECLVILLGHRVLDERSPANLVRNLIAGLGATLKRIEFTEMKDDDFVSRLVLLKGGEEIFIPVFPSDAIAIALKMMAPMFVEEQVVIDGTQHPNTQNLLSVIENFAPEVLEPDPP